MVATLARSGSTFITGNPRSFDAWGGIRGGPHSGAPKGRYCANLGHVQDDESGLVYMRARYYEPGTGRFVSEDPGQSGPNWYAYCGPDPVDFSDTDGKAKLSLAYNVALWLTAAISVVTIWFDLDVAQKVLATISGVIAIAAGVADFFQKDEVASEVGAGLEECIVVEVQAMSSPATQAASEGIAGAAIAAFSAEAGMDTGALISLELDD